MTRPLNLIILLSLICNQIALSQVKTTPAYLNSDLPVEKRIQDLLSRMTVEEKATFLDHKGLDWKKRSKLTTYSGVN